MNQISVIEHFDEWASYYDNDAKNENWVVPRRILLAVKPSIERNTAAPFRILDVGIGTGEVSLQLRRHYEKAEITGLDISSLMLKQSSRKNAADHFIQADIQKGFFPFSEQAFNLTVSGGVAEYFENPLNIVCEMVRVTRPDGLVALSYMPTKDSKSYRYEPEEYGDAGIFRWPRRYIEDIFSIFKMEKLVHTGRFVGYIRHDEPRKYAIFVGRVTQPPLAGLCSYLIEAAASKFPHRALQIKTARSEHALFYGD